MIRARILSGGNELARRLATHAGRLAEAQAEERSRAGRNDPWRWRKPSLLWPLFTKG